MVLALRCLSIKELMAEVCAHLSDKHDVVSLALTCRLLSEPALDLCWSRTIEIYQLIKTFPAELPLSEEDPRFHHPPQGHEWTRPLYYGAKIKDLLIGQMLHPLSYMAQYAPVVCLTPHLRRLALQYAHPGAIAYAPLFLHAALSEIALSGLFSEADGATFLKRIQMQCLGLRRLELRGLELIGDGHGDGERALCDLLGALHNLESVSLVSSKLLRTVAAISLPLMGRYQHLKSFTLSLSEDHVLPTLSKGPDIFPRLEQLTIDSHGSMANTVAVISAVQSAYLRDVSLFLSGCRHSTDLRPLFDALSSHPSINALEVSVAPDLASIATFSSLGISEVRALLDLRHIQNFSMVNLDAVTVLLDGEAVCSLVGTWANLRQLTIRPVYPRGATITNAESISMNHLVIVAKCCPHLQGLAMQFSAISASPPPPAERSAWPRQSSLLWFNVLSSNIGPDSQDASHTAAALRSLFPALRTLYFDGDDYSDSEVELWNEELRRRARQWSAVRDCLADL